MQLNQPDVSLENQHPSMVNRLGQTKFEHLSLKTPFKEIFNSKTQNVIQLHSAFVQHSDTDETTKQSISFEQSPWVLLIQCEQFSSGFANFG